MDKRQLFSSLNKVNEYRVKINENTEKHMGSLFTQGRGLDLLRNLRFSQSGYDPLFEEPTNFIEQTNQTFTYLVCLEAVEYLLKQYPGKSFYVCFGTESGHDVESEDGSIVCECFSATAPDSNKKLAKDSKKVDDNQTAKNKYVIYFASNPKPKHVAFIKNKYPNVCMIPLKSI